MKKLLFTAIAVLLSCTASAKTLTPDEALANALMRLNRGTTAHKSKAVGKIQSSIRLSYTEQIGNDTPLFYVYDTPEGGFIIAGADNRSESLLGYTDGGSFEDSKQNPAFKAWLTNCIEALRWLNSQPESPATVSDYTAKASTDIMSAVEPILGEIKWDQLAPYNNLCPVRSQNGKNKIALSGCVATAMAQVMGYYQWPVTGTGSHINKNDSSQTVDFSKSVYDWANIKPTYSRDEVGASADAIAKLMYDVGCAVDMIYNYGNSSAYETDIVYALPTYFGYDKDITYVNRLNYSTPEWNALIREELNEARPIIFSAQSSDLASHCFVIDGYDSNGLYHVNWGWGGMSNGYFDINYLAPNPHEVGYVMGDFNINQNAIVNIKKDTDGTSIAKPRLEITSSIYYDSYTNEFSFSFINYGVGDFTGDAGFVVLDENDDIVSTICSSFNTQPVSFNRSVTLSASLPSSLQIKEDYKVMPSYWDVEGDETHEFLSPLDGPECLISYLDEDDQMQWGMDADKLSLLMCTDFHVVRNYVGYAPKFALTLALYEFSQIEYNQDILIYLYKQTDHGTDKYCYGQTQLFLNPGETKTIDIECNLDAKFSYKDLTEGEYKVVAFYRNNGTDRIVLMDPEYFEMKNTEPSNLSFSGFALNKESFFSGDSLTVSFNIDNTGGFTTSGYIFNIRKENNQKAIGNMISQDYDISANSTTKVEIKGIVNLEPGSYYGTVYSNNGSDWSSDALYFTVNETPTAIPGIEEAEVSDSSQIYDIMGRRVIEMHKGGIYIINGNIVLR